MLALPASSWGRRCAALALASSCTAPLACSTTIELVPSTGAAGPLPDGGPSSSDDPTSADAGVSPLVDSGGPRPKPDAALDAAAHESGTGLPIDANGCYVLSASSFTPYGHDTGKYVAVRGELAGVGGSLVVHLRDPSLAAQTYALGVPPDDPFASPLHLVYGEPHGTIYASYYATEGSLTITSVTTPFTVEIAGSVSGLKLVEVMQVDGGVAKRPQGRCLSIANATFDTRVPTGAPCTSAMQCGSKACEPTTLTCQPSACTTPGQVAGGFRCVTQQGWSQPNALYRTCTLSAAPTGCAADEECIGAYSGVPNPPAYCVKRGGGALDAPCQSSDVLTACTAGLLCAKYVGMQYVCGTRCDPFGATATCPASERCQPYYANTVCAPKPPLTDNAAIDAPCAQSTPVYCADDGVAMRGACATDGPAPTGPRTCRKICRTNADCTGPKTCQMAIGLGNVCR
jgi:hypothetical protein